MAQIISHHQKGIHQINYSLEYDTNGSTCCCSNFEILDLLEDEVDVVAKEYLYN